MENLSLQAVGSSLIITMTIIMTTIMITIMTIVITHRQNNQMTYREGHSMTPQAMWVE